MKMRISLFLILGECNMSLKPFITAMSLLSAMFLTGCDNKSDEQITEKKSAIGSNISITIDHAQGRTDVPINPSKVIVFNTATLDTMDALDIKIAGVPKTSVHLPKFLQKYEGEEYFNAGTLFEPNYEALSSYKPDLIIAGGRTNDAYQKLSEIAPTISLTIDPKDFLNSLTKTTEQLGQIFNKQALAQQTLTEFKQKLEKVKAKAANRGTAMFILINGGKMAAYSPGSRFGFVFDELGFTPAVAFSETGNHGNIINAELLFNADPDWIFVLDRDSAIGNSNALSAKEVLNNPIVRRTKSWEKNQIIYLDSSSMYIAGGLQTYDHLLDQISQALSNSQE